MTGESGVVITTWGHIKASQLSRILTTNANLVHVQVSIENLRHSIYGLD